MKQELVIGSIIGSITLVIIGAIIVMNRPSAPMQPSPQPSPSAPVSQSEFAKHNSPSDCWILISGNVYNVTAYLNQHPGGPDKILPYCGGQDATQAFMTKGGRGRPHSPAATELHASMLVGPIAK